MLSPAEVAAEINKIEYKSDWWFSVDCDQEGQFVLITATLPNAHDNDDLLDIGVKSYLPPMRDRMAVHEWMTWRLGRIENHEMREFYRVNGIRIFDPHKEWSE